VEVVNISLAKEDIIYCMFHSIGKLFILYWNYAHKTV